MGHIAIADPSIGDGGTMTTVGSEAGSMPATNLQEHQPGERWRALSLASAFFTIDLGSAQSIDLIALLFTNASGSAQWRIRGATNEANLTASPGFDSTAVDLWPASDVTKAWPAPHGIHWLGTNAQSFRWWRVDILDASNPDGFFDAGRLYLSKVWQPSRNRQFGSEWGYVDPSAERAASSGASYVGDDTGYRIYRFGLELIPTAEMFDQALELDRLFGKRGDLLILQDPDETGPDRMMQTSIYGRQRALTPTVNFANNNERKRFEIREVLP